MSVDAHREILCSRSPGETRFAAFASGRLTDVVILRDGVADVGSVHYGRVVGPVPGVDAVFVDIGGERPGFLAVEDTRLAHPSPLHEGEAVLAQVTHAARGEKGAKLTLAITLAGADVVFSPFRPGAAVSRRISDAEERERLITLARPLAMAGGGVVIRSHAVGADADHLTSEVAALRQRWRQITAPPPRPPVCLDAGPDPLAEFLAWPGELVLRCNTPDLAKRARRLCQESTVTLHLGEDLFAAHGVDAAIEEALAPTVPLVNGGRLHIEPTAAVVAIDVDSGAAGQAALSINVRAADEIAHQIRLRNLSGHMIVDFIGMGSVGDMRRVVTALRSAVASDGVTVHVAGPTPLGLVEMVRERHRPPLAEFFATPSAVALEALRAVLREAAAVKVAGLGLAAAPEVITALRGVLCPAREEAEALLGHRLDLRALERGAGHQFEIFRVEVFRGPGGGQ